MSTASPTDKTARAVTYRAVDYLLIASIMGLMGAFFWAIRGTTGFGGPTGGALAGLGWALLWFGFSHFDGDGSLRPYGSGYMLAAITLGITFGGMTGYGVYISWLNGVYMMKVHEITREIAPWTGYLMLFFCGIHWGGVTGCLMSWVAPSKPAGWKTWVIRIAAGAGGAVLAGVLVRWFPSFFLPFYAEGYYQVEHYATSARAVRTINELAPHVGFVFGFLGFEIARRDWRAVKLILLMALGFALPFTIGGYWQTLHGSELKIDWWKNWEMTIGLGGGLSFGLAFFLFNRPTLTQPRQAGLWERILGVGLVLWITLASVILGGYEGFMRVHGLEDSFKSTQSEAYWLYQGLAAMVFVFWIVRTISMARQKKSEEQPPPLSMPCIGVLLAVIVLAGYATSIPGELGLANYVLLVLYTVYIGTSLILFGVLWRRRQV